MRPSAPRPSTTPFMAARNLAQVAGASGTPQATCQDLLAVSAVPRQARQKEIPQVGSLGRIERDRS